MCARSMGVFRGGREMAGRWCATHPNGGGKSAHDTRLGEPGYPAPARWWGSARRPFKHVARHAAMLAFGDARLLPLRGWSWGMHPRSCRLHGLHCREMCSSFVATCACYLQSVDHGRHAGRFGAGTTIRWRFCRVRAPGWIRTLCGWRHLREARGRRSREAGSARSCESQVRSRVLEIAPRFAPGGLSGKRDRSLRRATA
ncbi:hypothetical protein C8J57DRAFT_1336068 [Mycena rebaudengoi]|nr:hypothetical protein C8J57DRAFT_1336068 [Mycena rebaudengoi]